MAPVPTYPVQPAGTGYKQNTYPSVVAPPTPPQTSPESWAIDVDRAPGPTTAMPVATSWPLPVAPPVVVLPVAGSALRDTPSLSNFREPRRGPAGGKPPSSVPATGAGNPGWPSPAGGATALSAYDVAPLDTAAAGDVKPIGGGMRLSDFASLAAPPLAAPQRAAPAKRDLPPSFLLGEAS